MSLVPFTPLTGALDANDNTIIASTAMAMTLLAFSLVNQYNTQEKVEKEEQSDTNDGTESQPSLDDEILRILASSSEPLRARDIVKQLKDVTKSDVNSRLYRMLCRKVLVKKETGGAPLWSKK